MKKLLTIDVLENGKEYHEDLVFEIPGLLSQQQFDTYYFALAIEPKSGISEIKNAIAALITSWKQELTKLKNGDVIYLPIDFADQGTSSIKVSKNKHLTLTFGTSSREGWSINPLHPVDYYKSITDFRNLNENSLEVRQVDFEKCLTYNIEN